MEDHGFPPPELASSVVDLTASRRRRRNWREAVIGLAAALIIAAGVFGGLRMTAAPQVIKVASEPAWLSPGPGGHWEDAVGQSGGMSAVVMYRPMPWGTQFTASVNGIPSGTTCRIWVIGPGKTRLLAGSWTVDGDDSAVWYPGSAAISAPAVEQFVITVGKTRAITADA